MLKNNEKGFTTIDIGVAMMVIVVFASIMSSMIYSVYLSSTEAKRTALAINYVVDIFEYIALEEYSSMTPETVLKALKDNLQIENIKAEGPSGESTEQIATGEIGTYKLKLKMIIPYTDGTIKRFSLSIEYPISRKDTRTMEVERLRVIS